FQLVPQVWFDEGVRQHYVEQLPSHGEVVPFESAEDGLEVVTDFLDPLVFEQRTEAAQHAACLPLVRGQRHEPAGVWGDGKGETGQAGLPGVVTQRLNRNGDRVTLTQCSDEFAAS